MSLNDFHKETELCSVRNWKGTIITFRYMSLGIFSWNERTNEEFKRERAQGMSICAATHKLEIRERNILLVRTTEASTTRTHLR